MRMQSGFTHVVLAIAALLLVSLAGCGRNSWTEFRSEESRFAASFPGKPEQEIKVVNTAIGPIQATMYSVTRKDVTFNVTVSVYPPGHMGRIGSAAALDGGRDGMVSNTQGKLLSELIISIDGHPGREIKVSAAGRKATARSKILLVGDRLYQVIAVTREEDSYAPEVRRFLDSFRLL